MMKRFLDPQSSKGASSCEVPAMSPAHVTRESNQYFYVYTLIHMRTYAYAWYLQSRTWDVATVGIFTAFHIRVGTMDWVVQELKSQITSTMYSIPYAAAASTCTSPHAALASGNTLFSAYPLPTDYRPRRTESDTALSPPLPTSANSSYLKTRHPSNCLHS